MNFIGPSLPQKCCVPFEATRTHVSVHKRKQAKKMDADSHPVCSWRRSRIWMMHPAVMPLQQAPCWWNIRNRCHSTPPGSSPQTRCHTRESEPPETCQLHISVKSSTLNRRYEASGATLLHVTTRVINEFEGIH